MLQVTVIMGWFHGTGRHDISHGVVVIVVVVTITVIVVSSRCRRSGGCYGVGVVFGKISCIHRFVPRGGQFEHGNFVGGK